MAGNPPLRMCPYQKTTKPWTPLGHRKRCTLMRLANGGMKEVCQKKEADLLKCRGLALNGSWEGRTEAINCPSSPDRSGQGIQDCQGVRGYSMTSLIPPFGVHGIGHVPACYGLRMAGRAVGGSARYQPTRFLTGVKKLSEREERCLVTACPKAGGAGRICVVTI